MRMIVYTETVVYLAPPAFADDVPYQVVIVTRDDGSKVTGRIDGEQVRIGEQVDELEPRDGIPYFRKAS